MSCSVFWVNYSNATVKLLESRDFRFTIQDAYAVPLIAPQFGSFFPVSIPLIYCDVSEEKGMCIVLTYELQNLFLNVRLKLIDLLGKQLFHLL